MKLVEEDKELGVEIFKDEENIKIEKQENITVSFTYSNPEYEWVSMEENEIKLPIIENENLMIGRYKGSPTTIIGNSKSEKDCSIILPENINPNRIEIWDEKGGADIIENIQDNKRIQTKENKIKISEIKKGYTYMVAIISEDIDIHIDKINTKEYPKMKINLKNLLEKNKIKVRIPNIIKKGIIKLTGCDSKIEIKEEQSEYVIEKNKEEVEITVDEIEKKENLFQSEEIILETEKYAPVVKRVGEKLEVEIEDRELNELATVEIVSNHPKFEDISEINVKSKSNIENFDNISYMKKDYEKNYFDLKGNIIKNCIPGTELGIEIKSDYLRDKAEKEIKLEPGERREIYFKFPSENNTKKEIHLFIESDTRENLFVSYGKKCVQHKSGKLKEYRLPDETEVMEIKDAKMNAVGEVPIEDNYETPNLAYFHHN